MITSSGMRPTHKGWFAFCPVYVDMTDEDCPGVEARWAILEPLLTLATWLQGAAELVAQYIDPEHDPYWRIRITGEIRS